jgi:hypothetical protein
MRWPHADPVKKPSSLRTMTVSLWIQAKVRARWSAATLATVYELKRPIVTATGDLWAVAGI